MDGGNSWPAPTNLEFEDEEGEEIEFYDDNFEGEAYVSYRGAIYKVIYDDTNDLVTGGESTNIDMSTLGVNGNYITTIVHGTVEDPFMWHDYGGNTRYSLWEGEYKYVYDENGMLIYRGSAIE